MNLRILFTALMAVVATLLCTAGASASVTGLTSSEQELYEGNIVAESESHVTFHNAVTTIDCDSEVGVDVEINGEEPQAGGPVELLSFTACTNGWHVTTTTKGSLWVEHTSGNNGTVFSTGATIEATAFGGLLTCRYATSNTAIGTLTGGTPATLHIEAAIPFHSGSGLCGPGALTFTGDYVVTTPAPLTVADLLLYRAEKSGAITYYGAIAAGQSSEWVIGGSKASCAEAKFQSAAVAAKARIKILSLAPTYNKCTNFGLEGTAAANECKFQLQQPRSNGGKIESKVTIKCPSGKSISLISKEGAEVVCEVLIGEFGNVSLERNTYTNNTGVAPWKFDISFELSKIKGEVKKAIGKCPLIGKVGIIEGITYKAQVTIEDLAQKEGAWVG